MHFVLHPSSKYILWKCTFHAGQRYGITKMVKGGIAENERLEAAHHSCLKTQCNYQEGDIEMRDKYYETMAVVPFSVES